MSHVITPTFRVSYPNVFVPKYNDLAKKNEYSVVALFAKGESLQVLEKAILAAAIKKWGEGTITKGVEHKAGNFYFKTGKALLPIRLPFRDQGEQKFDKNGAPKEMPESNEKGAMYINLKSKNKPGLVDQQRQEIIDDSTFYAGCYAKAAVSAFAYDQLGNKGISFGLQALQKVRDGEPLGNRVDPQTAFEPIEDMGVDGDATSLFG